MAFGFGGSKWRRNLGEENMVVGRGRNRYAKDVMDAGELCRPRRVRGPWGSLYTQRGKTGVRAPRSLRTESGGRGEACTPRTSWPDDEARVPGRGKAVDAQVERPSYVVAHAPTRDPRHGRGHSPELGRESASASGSHSPHSDSRRAHQRQPLGSFCRRRRFRKR